LPLTASCADELSFSTKKEELGRLRLADHEALLSFRGGEDAPEQQVAPGAVTADLDDGCSVNVVEPRRSRLGKSVCRKHE
jgi:hypothetical protein